MNRRALLWYGASAGWVVVAGCRKRRSPEEQVRDAIAAVAGAVEDKNLKAIRAAVSERYRDGEQNDRQDLLSLLRGYLARHPHVHLLTRVTAVEIAPAGQARVTVVVAMAALPMKVLEDLPRLQADVHRFDLTLAEEAPQTWTVTRAAWQPARPEDLF